MKKGIFGPNNPNHDIFAVPTEEGPDEEDNMASMIGDATMHHLNSLTPFQRQCWEHYVVTGGENLFFFTPSPTDVDQDPYNLKVEDLDHYFENNQVPESMRVHLEEAIEQEKERREKSQDAYDRATELIPFQDWEDNPGLFAHYDLPTTPKNLAIFAGNTQRMFYDYFPEGHPDAKRIEQYFGMMNQDEMRLTPKYGEFVKQWLERQPFRDEYTQLILAKLTDYIVIENKDPEDIAIKALNFIDEHWRQLYVAASKERLQKDSVYQLLKHKEIEWAKMFDEGVSVVPAIKAFGQLLFTNFRKQMRKHHWAIYKSLKNKYNQPKLMFKGVDINSCRPQELERAFNIDRSTANAIWHARPFMTIQELTRRTITEHRKVLQQVDGEWKHVLVDVKVQKGWLTQEAVEERGELEDVYTLIHQKEAEAREKRNLKVFSALSQELISRQKKATDKFSTKEWGLVWNLYRSTKDDILSSLRGQPA